MNFDFCNLCNSNTYIEVAPKTSRNLRMLLCRRCALIYASPGIAGNILDYYYETEFSFDPGSNFRTNEGEIDEKAIIAEENRASEWAVPIITSYTSVSGKKYWMLDVGRAVWLPF